MKAGDLIAFSGRTWVSDFVNVATYGIPRWSISHVGIVCKFQNQLLLIESTTLEDSPCEITGQRLNGVQGHTIETDVEGYKGRVWVYPLYRPLYEAESKRLTDFLIGKIGTPYDANGAVRSGGLLFSTLECLLRPEDLQSLFCSELLAKAYAEIGLLTTDNASRWSPNHLARHMRHHKILLKPVRLK